MKRGERKPYEPSKPPWAGEPDLKQWTHRGYPCVAVRNPLGVWLAYVGVPREHPWFDQEPETFEVHVHGGVTWTGPEVPLVPDAYDLGKRRWWVGWDAGHYGDLQPRLAERFDWMRNPELYTYRTLDYAVAVTNALAEQAEEAAEQRGKEELP